ncbi:MAG: hypothetical protein ACM37W_20095 [Actinomycetota bacterium]
MSDDLKDPNIKESLIIFSLTTRRSIPYQHLNPAEIANFYANFDKFLQIS